MKVSFNDVEPTFSDVERTFIVAERNFLLGKSTFCPNSYILLSYPKITKK